jgi:hypothetical protein
MRSLTLLRSKEKDMRRTITTTAALVVGLALTGMATAGPGKGGPGSGGSAGHQDRTFKGATARNYHEAKYFDKHERRERDERRLHHEPFRDYKGYSYRGRENHFWSRCYWDRYYGCPLYPEIFWLFWGCP